MQRQRGGAVGGGEGTEEVTTQKSGLCLQPWQGSSVGVRPDL